MYDKGEYYIKLKDNDKISKEFFSFLNLCLQKDPKKRINALKIGELKFIIGSEEQFCMLDQNELLEAESLIKTDNDNRIILDINKIYFEEDLNI